MLKAVFVGALAPNWAENILNKRKPGSYLVRQSDLDPSLLLLSFVDVGHDIKHAIVPELRGASHYSMKRKLDNDSDEVEKFLKSFGCKYPVISETESHLSSFKVKTRPEGGDGAMHRCCVCTFESEDLKKVRKHRDHHRVGHCSNCDSYLLQKKLAYHTKKCSKSKIYECEHEQKCDYTSPHKWMVERHVKEVHCKPHPCQECGKSFKSSELLEGHMKIHQKRFQCKVCDKTFKSKTSKYRHMKDVHISPTIRISNGFMRFAGQSLSDQYKRRGKKLHYCRDCSYKTSNKTHFQNHSRIHLATAKKVRPDRFKCVTTCGYQHKWRYKVKLHMKNCRKYLLTTDYYRPKGMLTNERVCLLADRVDISNKKMQTIVKEFGDVVGRELIDYNLRGALSERLNSTAEFYYSKRIQFTNKKGEERLTSFVCMKDLRERIEDIMRRRAITNAMVVISFDGGQDKLLSTMAVFDLNNPDERTDAGFSVGGRKQIFLVAAAANVPENRAMVKMFFREMKVKNLDMPFILIGDEKMKNLMFGKLEEIIETRPGVDKVKPKGWCKYSLQTD